MSGMLAIQAKSTSAENFKFYKHRKKGEQAEWVKMAGGFEHEYRRTDLRPGLAFADLTHERLDECWQKGLTRATDRARKLRVVGARGMLGDDMRPWSWCQGVLKNCRRRFLRLNRAR
jgi:hypothetical protein